MGLEHTKHSGELLDELVEYTGRDRELVKERCKTSRVELAWLWGLRKDTIDFYRSTDLYIFDLTLYQSLIVPEVNYMMEEIGNRRIKKILDFGGGIGEYTIRAIKECGAEVTYLEIAGSQTLKYAEHRFKKHGVKPKIVDENYEWWKEDWDAIVAMDVLEHLEDPAPVIEKFGKSTKFLFANPEKIMYNAVYPQHVSKPELKGFENIEINLYQNSARK